jgi:hypothetical protein
MIIRNKGRGRMDRGINMKLLKERVIRINNANVSISKIDLSF